LTGLGAGSNVPSRARWAALVVHAVLRPFERLAGVEGCDLYRGRLEQLRRVRNIAPVPYTGMNGLKPNDIVLLGTWQKHLDQVGDDARLVRRILRTA
jgi:hypothetical protein